VRISNAVVTGALFQCLGIVCELLKTRGESKPERRSGERIIAGTAFRLEYQIR